MNAPEGRLPRTLGLWSSVALVIGITIGSGIFRSPAGIARQAPNPLVMIGLWVVGGAITLCGALSLAELAAALPETGGFYAYLREGWGRRAAFLFGWSELVLIRASALGGIAVVFGEYLLRSFGIDPSSHVLVARGLSAAAIVFAAAVNVRGANLGALIVGVATWAKFGALALLVLASFTLGGVARRQRGSLDGTVGGTPCRRQHRPGARQRAVGLRRVGRSVLCLRRSEEPGAESPAGHHPGHTGADRHLRPDQPRLPLRAADRSRRPVAARRGGHHDGALRPRRRRAGLGVRDDFVVQLAERQHAGVAPGVLRDGGRRAVVSRRLRRSIRASRRPTWRSCSPPFSASRWS